MDNEKPAKTAILVIHGIGQQQPYETLDAFARGFSQALSERDRRQWTIRHDLANLNGYTESRLHLSPPSQGETRGGESFDLYEVCWSPLTQRQIGYRQVLRFLQKAALSPLRYFATNLELLAEEQRAGKRPTGPAWVFVKEMFRIVILYLPVLFLLVAAGALFSDVPLLKNSFSSATDMLKSKLQIGWKGMGLIYLELVLWILLFMVTDSLFKLRKDRESMNRSAEKVWKRYLICSSIGLTLLLSLKIWVYESFLGEALIAIPANLWIAVIALFLSFKAKRILVDFIGDITIYVNMDENSEFYRTRTAILKEATDKLRWLIRQKEYDRVIVAGHSLGSVVAHNAINHLLLEVERDGNDPSHITWDEVGKITTLVTFGSPLDKVYYFFRTHVSSDQKVRAQILSDRYPFARRHSRSTRAGKGKQTTWSRNYDNFTFVDPPSPRLLYPDRKAPSIRFSWLNFWYATDPVSANLDFYDQDRLTNIPLPSPWYRFGISHTDYWSDRLFYENVIARI